MLTVTTMPFSYSIANGIGVGFIAWVVLRSMAGKRSVRCCGSSQRGFLIYFARDWIESLIGM